MTETYSKSSDFGNQLAPGQFHNEIVADPGITTTLVGVNVDGDIVDVVFVSTISAGEKTTLDGLVAAHTPDLLTNEITTASGYIEFNSSLADNGALRLVASNVAGGIDVDAGSGGITINTTNAFQVNAGALVKISNTAGNIELDTPGLIDLNSSSGINIGNDADAVPINIGTGVAQKNITIGNQTGTTKVDVRTGSGGFNVDASGGKFSIDGVGASSNITLTGTADGQDLTIALTGGYNGSIIISSTGTAVDAIKIAATNTSGGIDVDCSTGGYRLDTTGQCYLASSKAAGGAITLDNTLGGLTFSGGPFGVAINSGTGLIGIGHWSAGNIDIGTSATARTITMGNITGATSLVFNAGTGGIAIGNNQNTGEIQIGNVDNSKTIILGNNSTNSQTFIRDGKFLITSQGAEESLSDASGTLTMTQLSKKIFKMTPTTDRTLTLPDASACVSGISGVGVNDAFEFRIINEATGVSDPTITLAMGTSGTSVGYMDVPPRINNAATYLNCGLGVFLLRFTNTSPSSESYVVYRYG